MATCLKTLTGSHGQIIAVELVDLVFITENDNHQKILSLRLRGRCSNEE